MTPALGENLVSDYSFGKGFAPHRREGQGLLATSLAAAAIVVVGSVLMSLPQQN